MPKDLTSLFCPKSVAIIGASRDANKVGAIVLNNMLASEFKGSIYPINPNIDELQGLKCYKSIADIKESIDLAIIAIPAKHVLATMEQLALKKVKSAVVLSAGFKEEGEEGKKLEDQLIEVATKNSKNILGPNCLGFVNQTCALNATFGKVSLQQGKLRFISQSGALATSLFDWFSSINLGFNQFITMGNKAVINECDILENFLEQEREKITQLIGGNEGAAQTYPIGMYLESIVEGPRFIKLCKQLSQTHFMYILKPGKTKQAASAMLSHTGAIAGADDILEEALNEAGITRCRTLEEFFDLSKALAWSPMPLGPKVAIISNAGGPAVISTDALIEKGLELAQFDTTTTNSLKCLLPPSANILNPVDVLGDALADRFTLAADIILKNKACDALLVILTPQVMTQIAETAKSIGAITAKYKKPVICSFIGGSQVKNGSEILTELKIPAFNFPEQALQVISYMWKFQERLREATQDSLDINDVLNTSVASPEISELISKAVSSGKSSLDNIAAAQVVSSCGILTPEALHVETLKQAEEFGTRVGYPLVLKLSSPGLLHKKHLGGVILDIRSEQQLEDAWDTMVRKTEHLDPKIKTQVKFQIQKEVPNGIEVLIGVKKDPTFGPVILFGAGGSFTELILDRNIALLPIDLKSAKKLVKRSAIYKVLSGSQNEPAYALDKLYRLIVDVSKILENFPLIEEVEINPVIVSLNDVWAVDPKVILKQNATKPVGPKFKVATTTKSDLLAAKIRLFEFEADTPLVCTAGQYISVKVSNTRINCYSIAEKNSASRFKLLVDSSPGGPGSKFFEQLKVGDKITYLGPLGTFSVKQDQATTLIFMGTGSGIAPLKYMIENELANKTTKDLVLYIGLNNSSEIFMRDYFDKLAKTHPNFSYKISICEKCEDWPGNVGFITDLLKKDFPDTRKCSAYLCGNKFMIADSVKILKESGCPSERIYTEKL